MTKPDPKVIKRIKKLFALSSSPNQHEAEAALTRANDLMEKHQLEFTDLALIELKHGVDSLDCTLGEVDRKDSWYVGLANTIAEFYDGRALVYTHYTSGIKIQFAGHGQDLVAMKFTFLQLVMAWRSIHANDSKILKRKWTQLGDHWTSRVDRDFKVGHGLAFALAIQERCEVLKRKRKETVMAGSTRGTELVVAKEANIAAWLVSKGIRTKTLRGSIGSSIGRKLGKEAGANIPLAGAVKESKND